MTPPPLTFLWVAVLGLAASGLYGLLSARNLIKLVISLQLLAKAGLVALVVAGQASGQINLGQSLAMTAIVADTLVTVIGLALAVLVRRRFGTLDLRALSTLKR